MNCSLMETEEDNTLFLFFDTSDLEQLVHISERGCQVLPGIDMLALAKATDCGKVVTNLQVVVGPTEESFTAFMMQLGKDMGLAVRRRGEIHPGGYITDNPEDPDVR